ncbi:WYL domain-containing protein [Brachybacterium sp. DNPG3]
MAAKSTERLLNVIMTIGSRRRIDRAKLFAAIPEYREADAAAERMFERDKAQILDLGLPLSTETDLFDQNTVYYRIDTAAGDAVLDLSREEYTVLLAASRAWDDAAAGGAARRVRAKLLSLGHDADPDLLRRTPRGTVESLPVLTPLLEAVTAGRAVRFDYRGTDNRRANRHVEPWAVGVHDGHWYVHGWDLDREAPRIFRASRIESYPEVRTVAAHPRPADVSLATALSTALESMHANPEGEQRMIVRAAPYKALALRDLAGAALDDGTLELPAMPRSAARRLALADIRWIEVVEPVLWREEISAVLGDIADAHAASPDLAALEAAVPRDARRIRTPTAAGDHLSRLISEASYVMSRDEVETAELAGALGISEKQLIKDLQVLFLCGDFATGWEQDLIEAEWEHGVVRVRNAEPLRRALRLSRTEITALLAGLSALEPSAGETAGLVASATAKLRAELGASADGAPAAEAASPAEETGTGTGSAAEDAGTRTASRADAVLAAVGEALRTEGGTLTIRYSAPDSAGTSVRTIRPIAIETDGTRSYLRAHCELRGDERQFRLDRIVEILPADAPGRLSEEGTGPDLRGTVDGEVWLRLDAPGRWIAESFAAAELRDGDGPLVYARLEHPVRAALVDAVLESAGAAEVLLPRDLRDTIVIVARDSSRPAHRN